jgi:hypothetical protein
MHLHIILLYLKSVHGITLIWLSYIFCLECFIIGKIMLNEQQFQWDGRQLSRDLKYRNVYG